MPVLARIKGIGLNKNNLEVNCYSGHTYAEEPRSFRWESIDYDIQEIESAWLEPGERHFQARTRDNKRFRLCYNETQREWSAIELVHQGQYTGNESE